MSRLGATVLTDFTGGLNLWASDFQLADNETPEMANVHVDVQGGFITRAGMQRWNPANVIKQAEWDGLYVNNLDAVYVTADGTPYTAPLDEPTLLNTWAPRNAFMHTHLDGSASVFITNEGTIYRSGSDKVFTDTGVACSAGLHLADFAGWGDTAYMVTGSTAAAKYEPVGGVTALTPAATATWNNNYTTPARNNVMASGDVICSHIGYLFVGSTYENGTAHPTRLRWSHPSEPGDWAEQDYIDIDAGGGRITALATFSDHLLIFKDASIWALYGFNEETWQLIEVSQRVGTIGPHTVTASESAVFFFSATGRGGIYGYSGSQPVLLSDKIRPAVSAVVGHDNIWLGWAATRLLVALPWHSDFACTCGAIAYEPGPSLDGSTTLFVFDPSIGNGAWEMHRPARGSIGPIIEDSDIRSPYPLAVSFGCLRVAAAVELGAVTIGAYDLIDEDGSEAPFFAFLTTSWKYDGTPDLRKSWRRPRYIAKQKGKGAEVLVEVLRDYERTSPVRAGILTINPGDSVFWRDLGADDLRGDGFDWDDGTLWAAGVSGAAITRGSSLGHARSVQLRFRTAPSSLGKDWGMDAIVLKHINRRATT